MKDDTINLTPEHLEELCANALVDVPKYVSVSEPPAYSVAYAVAKAMRQPITAEALEAAGWKQASGDDMVYWTRACGPVLECEFNIAGEATVTIDLPEALTAILFRGCRTMHDLREIVRLLGGA